MILTNGVHLSGPLQLERQNTIVGCSKLFINFKLTRAFLKYVLGSTEIALDVMLMLCGLCAIPVNGLLCLILLGIKK